MKIREDFTCPLEICFDIIKGKWKPIIIWLLRLGPTQPSKLLHDIKGISEKMLQQQLKELLLTGIIGKISYDGYPNKVKYFLTDVGCELLQALEVFQRVGIYYLNEKNIEKEE